MSKNFHAFAIAAAALTLAIPAVAQMPGAPDASRVAAGTYKVDPNHTQVVWTLSHMGVSALSGAFGAGAGTLEIDPAHLSAAKVSVTFDVADMSTTASAFTKHLSGPEFFDVTKYPKATFVSTAVRANGSGATIAGNLTIKGVTKPVTLDAKFYGAGTSPMSKKLNVGFSATTSIKRSDFGLGAYAPAVADDVDLQIHGAFERVG